MEDIIRLGKKKYCQGEPIATLRLPGSLHCAAVESGQCHVNGFYFCLIMLFAGKPRVSMRGCSAAVSQCLTGGFVLSLSGCSHWREGGRGGVGWGWGFRGALTANSMNPPGALASSASLPPFPLASFLLPSVFLFPVALSPSLSSWPCHLQSWTGGQLGLIPELARHSWPIRSCHRGHLTQ